MKTSKNPLDMSENEIADWADKFVGGYDGWYYIRGRSAKLLTTYYARLVVKKEVPASNEVIEAAQRHLNDLKRSKEKDFPYYFDEAAAWRPIKFIEENIKPSKGDFDNLFLQPFQHFIIGSLFGWKEKRTKLRRYTKGHIYLGRKNGKTTLISGLAAYMAGYDGENGAEVYALSNSQKQSRILYEETSNMIKVSPYLLNHFKVTRDEIKHEKTASKIQALSAEKHNKDGFNASFSVFDEIHEFKDYELINVMQNSMVTRRQPLTIFISTAGYVLDGPMVDYFQNGQDVLGDYDANIDPHTFFFMAKLDDKSEADDPNMWIKANPNMPMMGVKKMVEDYKVARRTPQLRADWLTKRFNIFSESGENSLFDIDTILSNNEVIDEAELDGLHPVAGFDLSDTEDFTAAALEFALPDGRIYIRQQTWIPQARYDREEQYKKRFDEWIDSGEMIVLPGAHVDHRAVYDWIVEQDNKYGIEQINYDQAKAITLNELIEDYGVETQVTRQGFTTLGAPLQNFKELMLDSKVVFDNSAIFKWYLSNVAVVVDRNNNWLPTKVSRYRKIDGFAAALNAHVTIAPRLVEKAEGTGMVEFMSMDELMNTDWEKENG
jgi:phage terminase large subunit-like protein